MLEARSRKLTEEVERIRAATRLATAALDTVMTEARPGMPERDLKARFEQRMAELGTTTPAFEGTFGHVFPSDRAIEAGEQVVFDVGVLVDGYEGGVARTVGTEVGGGDLFDVRLANLAPGATVGADVEGVGLGYE